ncbi:hypothetical protein [Streptomyces sp. MBT33]|uniref:hypothetical protein n=1 Tax=Streptomyces sp. MBT33 TaxID=1488363 RepID=UPI00190AB3D4|nr:hypothetical protein [Streptomyces sp. MBT33]MBK3643731.1 hypothetical protein [Streptomyces sp. MBT33]
MKQSGTSALLQDAVLDMASSVASALGGGGHAPDGTTADGGPPGDLELAAARVLGADLMLPGILCGIPPAADRLDLAARTLEAFPPRPESPPTVRWSHWALRRALRLTDPSGTGADVRRPPEPDAAWLDGAPWPFLTHQLAVLAPLALPGQDCAPARAARGRTLDVARGFVRAVRRRDWLQAAGAGRWLTLLPDVPETLGLAAGLDFVELMGGDDPRVLLQVRAARLIGAGAPV